MPIICFYAFWEVYINYWTYGLSCFFGAWLLWTKVCSWHWFEEICVKSPEDINCDQVHESTFAVTLSSNTQDDR